jgi:hypothetical protein
MRKGILAVVLAGLASTAVSAVPTTAQAQGMPSSNPGRIEAMPKGLIGGALLGAEAVILIEGAAGVRNRWVLLGTGAAGLVAGGVGGYFLDRALDEAPAGGGSPDRGLPLISTGMLVVGLGLVIPTTIMYLSATMYRPEDSAPITEEAPANVPLDESTGEGSASRLLRTPARTARAPQRSVPLSLFEYAPDGLRVGLPVVGMVGSYSVEERLQYGLAPQSEWRVSLLSATF